MRKHARSRLLLIVLFLAFCWTTIFSPNQAYALDCQSNSYILPQNPEPGGYVDFYLENRASGADESITITVNGTTELQCGSEFGTTCPGPGSSLLYYDIPSSAAAGTTYIFSLRYFDGTGNPPCTAEHVATVETTDDPVCEPVGIVSVSPLQGNTNDTYIFTGCLGSFIDGYNPGVIIDDVTPSGPGYPTIELQLSESDLTDDGQFQVSRGTFQPGVWSATLFNNFAQVGGVIEFRVEGFSTGCSEIIECTGPEGQLGTQACPGSITPPSTVCEYDPASCGECRYCGNDICEDDETDRSCPADCTDCGNGLCEFGEEATCPEDCRPPTPAPTPDPGDDLPAFQYCQQVPADLQGACTTCMSGGTGTDGQPDRIFTAVGCIRLGERELVADLVKLLLGVGGGVALLSILAAAFILATSSGDTNRVKQGRELMTAAVSGLLFMIFSVIILQFIGYDILRIPGLGE